MEYPLRAFTILETLVVIGIFTILGSVGSIIGFSAYQQSLTDIDRDQLLSIIRLARASARNTVDTGGSGYGVHVTSNGITVFAGSSFQSRDTAHDVQYPFFGKETVSSDRDMVFEPVSGSCIAGGTITLVDHAGIHIDIQLANDGSIDVINHA